MWAHIEDWVAYKEDVRRPRWWSRTPRLSQAGRSALGEPPAGHYGSELSFAPAEHEEEDQLDEDDGENFCLWCHTLLDIDGRCRACFAASGWWDFALDAGMV